MRWWCEYFPWRMSNVTFNTVIVSDWKVYLLFDCASPRVACLFFATFILEEGSRHVFTRMGVCSFSRARSSSNSMPFSQSFQNHPFSQTAHHCLKNTGSFNGMELWCASLLAVWQAHTCPVPIVCHGLPWSVLLCLYFCVCFVDNVPGYYES